MCNFWFQNQALIQARIRCGLIKLLLLSCQIQSAIQIKEHHLIQTFCSLMNINMAHTRG